ncbi:MAG: ligD [Actinomycetia bacterium]|nr:ligD [Actinomycetes bacterium]
MFAMPGTMPNGPGWAYEVKWDGVRAISTVSDGALRIVGRNGRDITARYPEIQGLVEALGVHEAVLDGEIIAYDDRGLPSFERLQARMHVDEPAAVDALTRSVPVAYMIFDVLAIDGEVLATFPYAQRRARLESLALDGPAWHVPPNEVGDGSTIEAFTRLHAIEGIVAKRLDSRYEPGRHSPAWRKIKHTRRQEFVIGGWTPGERGRTGDIGALVLGVYEPDELDQSGASRLRCCGRVGSGFSQDTLVELRRVLAPLARVSSPFDAGSVPRRTNFVEPRLVAEVRFAQWTTAHIVRAAVFLGLRTDKDPRTVTREA